MRQASIAKRPWGVSAAVAIAGLCMATAAQARCMNAQNTSIPHSTLPTTVVVNADGTVLARATGLMWARCLVGQSLVDGVCSGAPAFMLWEEALAAARSSRVAGHGDWRLPNAKELLSIIDDRCAAPSLNAELFPISVEFAVWTSTPFGWDSGQFAGAWTMTSNGSNHRVSWVYVSSALLVRDAR